MSSTDQRLIENQCIQSDVVATRSAENLRGSIFDFVFINPPYVPTPSEELKNSQLTCAIGMRFRKLSSFRDPNINGCLSHLFFNLDPFSNVFVVSLNLPIPIQCFRLHTYHFPSMKGCCAPCVN